MPVVQTNYIQPRSWSDMRVDYAGNADSADWPVGLREALLERLSVLIDNPSLRNDQRNRCKTMAYQLASFPSYCGHERYAFARFLDESLDYLLTPYKVWQTVSNLWTPHLETGFFVRPGSPSHYMKRIDFSGMGGYPETEVVADYLKVADMTADPATNYKAALATVGRCSPPSAYLPFMRAVRAVLNRLHVVRTSCKYVASWAGCGTTEYYDSASGAISEMNDAYDEEMDAQPNLAELYESTGFELYCHSSLSYNGSKYYGRLPRWQDLFVLGVADKVPVRRADVSFCYWATDHSGGSSTWEYGWDDPPYTVKSQSCGTMDGLEHTFRGGPTSFLDKWPSHGVKYPSAPSTAGVTNNVTYDVSGEFFADYGVQGGFNFMN